MRPSSITCLLLALVGSVSGLGAWSSRCAAQGSVAQPAPKPSAPAKPVAQPAPKPAPKPAPAAEPEKPATPAAASSSPAAAPTASTPPASAATAPEASGDAAAPAAAPAPSESAEGADASASSAAAPSAPAPSEATLPAAALPPSNVPSPGELGDRLVGDLPPESTQKTGWTAPLPVLTLHGYLRVRGELMDHFWLGRGTNDEQKMAAAGGSTIRASGFGPDPFTRFRPLERTPTVTDCGGQSKLPGGGCDISTLRYADMRFRLNPQLNISEDVRVKATFDVFDNFVLGSGPVSYYGSGATASTAFASTDAPNVGTIVARRAWAEVRNRDLGELRFGIMPQQWGLGMVYNAGNGLDDDYSTDLGRVMGITKVAGFYLSASYDFLAEGITGFRGTEQRPSFDASQIDDLDQFSFSIARRMPDEDEDSVLERGDALWNGGVHFVIRNQDARLSALTGTNPLTAPKFETINATYYTPDVWGQFKYRGLRLEFEGAAVLGSVTNPTATATTKQSYNVSEFGAVFESELRALDKKLGIYFYTGIASGDSDVEGLSADANYIDQMGNGKGTNNTVSTFRFHPAYRVDSILWRNLMGAVAGAYYFKPGVSYDFVKDDFGQLFGARVDMIWSRASSFMQTWGNNPNLGIELNAKIYWRSDDGPDKENGYHAALQYGVLFPMRGLGYYYKDANLDTAQSLRLLLGVQF